MTRTISLREGTAAVLTAGLLVLSTACGSSSPKTEPPAGGGSADSAPEPPQSELAPGLALPIDAAAKNCESVLKPAYAKAVGADVVAKVRDDTCVLNLKSEYGDFAGEGMETWVITDADLHQEPATEEEGYEQEMLADLHENAYLEWGADTESDPETTDLAVPLEGGRLLITVMKYDDSAAAKAAALALAEALVATA